MELPENGNPYVAFLILFALAIALIFGTGCQTTEPCGMLHVSPFHNAYDCTTDADCEDMCMRLGGTVEDCNY